MEKDEAEGARYLKMSADQGHPDGQSAYAKCLSEGTGVPRDSSEADRYYKMHEDSCGMDESDLFDLLIIKT